jgi:hypothetical protein
MARVAPLGPALVALALSVRRGASDVRARVRLHLGRETAEQRPPRCPESRRRDLAQRYALERGRPLRGVGPHEELQPVGSSGRPAPRRGCSGIVATRIGSPWPDDRPGATATLTIRPGHGGDRTRRCGKQTCRRRPVATSRASRRDARHSLQLANSGAGDRPRRRSPESGVHLYQRLRLSPRRIGAGRDVRPGIENALTVLVHPPVLTGAAIATLRSPLSGRVLCDSATRSASARTRRASSGGARTSTSGP